MRELERGPNREKRIKKSDETRKMRRTCSRREISRAIGREDFLLAFVQSFFQTRLFLDNEARAAQERDQTEMGMITFEEEGRPFR